MIMSPDNFLSIILEKVKKEVVSDVRFAKIAPSYTSGKPALVFDGDTQETLKTHPYLSSYTPIANDRVMVVKGVIVGKII